MTGWPGQQQASGSGLIPDPPVLQGRNTRHHEYRVQPAWRGPDAAAEASTHALADRCGGRPVPGRTLRRSRCSCPEAEKVSRAMALAASFFFSASATANAQRT
jgi:hypothetical protein